MTKNKTINLEELYFYICTAQNKTDENFVLIKSEKIENCSIFFVKKSDDLSSRLSDISFPFEIYLSNPDNHSLEVAIECRYCTCVYIPDVLFQTIISPNNKIKSCEKFEEYFSLGRLMLNSDELINQNIALKKFVDSRFSGMRKPGIYRRLIENNIFSLQNDEHPVFTKFGSIMFENDCKYVRRINILTNFINTNHSYSLENNVNLPLYLGVTEFCYYVLDKLPIIQDRENVLSKTSKPFTEKDISRALLTTITFNSFDSYSPIEVMVSSHSISFRTARADENKEIKRMVKYIFGSISFSSDDLNNGIELIIRNKGNKCIVDLINHHNLNIKDFDEIDYKIIEFAKSIGIFRRSDIDERFHISNRNANYRLKNLIVNGFLTKEGTGKLSKYVYTGKQ